MYVARIRFRSQENTEYKVGQVEEIFKNDKYLCRFWVDSDWNFEIIYGNFEDKNTAFIEGRKLYFEILYLSHTSQLPFGINAIDYKNSQRKRFTTGNHRCFKKGIAQPLDFYECNKNSYNNDFFGLEVYEIEKDYFSDYSYKKDNLVFEEYAVSHFRYNFESLGKLECVYNDFVYRIFSVLELAERSFDNILKIVFLMTSLEIAVNCEVERINMKSQDLGEASLSDKEIKLYELRDDKDCVEKKCRIFLNNYMKCSSKVKRENIQKFMKLYDIRSKFTHGTPINEIVKEDEYNNFKLVFLQTIYEMNKISNLTKLDF